MENEVLITCQSCRQKFPMKELKYDKNGEDLICNECFGSSRSPEEAKKDMKNMNPETLEKTGPRKFTQQISTKYICMSCQYKFTRQKEYEVFKCPYCDSENLKKEKGIHSQQLIDSSKDLFN